MCRNRVQATLSKQHCYLLYTSINDFSKAKCSGESATKIKLHLLHYLCRLNHDLESLPTGKEALLLANSRLLSLLRLATMNPIPYNTYDLCSWCQWQSQCSLIWTPAHQYGERERDDQITSPSLLEFRE